MLQQVLIGRVGADAELQSKDGKKFTTFRVAHSDAWTDEAGTKHESTVWVDCIMNDHPKVAEYLKTGQLVAIIGSVSLRVYSSAKDRCMKAGMTISVNRIELLGGPSDAVPSRLYDCNGVLHEVKKYYLVDVKSQQLLSVKGAAFNADENGWVTPVTQQPQESEQQKDGYDGF